MAIRSRAVTMTSEQYERIITLMVETIETTLVDRFGYDKRLAHTISQFVLTDTQKHDDGIDIQG